MTRAVVTASRGASEAVREARCVLFAYHEMGAACLEALVAMGAPIAALFTHRDASGEEIWWHSCAEAARANSIAVYTPEKIEAAEIAQVAALRPAVERGRRRAPQSDGESRFRRAAKSSPD